MSRGSGPQAARCYMECLADRLRTARHVRRAVLLLEALDIHPPLQGFEALLTASGRMKE